MGPAAVTPWLQPAQIGGRVGPTTLLAITVLVGAGAAIVWRRAATGTEPPVGPTEDPTAPLDDTERVTGLLRASGGRMRQSAIVEETGWSKSKVSTVLSEMVDRGGITKLRLGRENLICLPGHEPEASRSPHDRHA